MKDYVVLLRGVNVGGKGKVSMAELRTVLEEQGFSKVATYIASGNVMLQSDKSSNEIKTKVATVLAEQFGLDSTINNILVLTHAELKSAIDNKPEEFGNQPDKYHSDAIFLIDIDADTAMQVFDPRKGVDKVWPGKGVIYSQRLSAERTKSRLSKIVGTPAYHSMTIRSWNTTTKLLELMEARA